VGLKTGLYVLEKRLGSFRFSKAYSWLHDLYSLRNIIGVPKSRGMRWAGNMAGVGDRTDAYRVLVGRTDGANFEDLGVGGIKLK
jgi:hypothetical protein